MPGAVLPVTERPPSLRISLRKKAMALAQEASPIPTPPKTSIRAVSKKRGKTSGTKSRGQPVTKGPIEVKTRTTKGKGSRTTKHSKPWEVDDGEDHAYDYLSSTESELSSGEEDYLLKASQAHTFLEDELDDESVMNDAIFNCSEDDAECSRLPWVDLTPEEIPPLELPESSKDIPIPSEYLLDTVELYELLRSYWRTLRLSPFLFEDFCAALSSPDNSCLLSEIHIVLLKMSFKNDDDEQVHFSGNETNNAYNIVTACLESMTYAEVLRQYLSCDPNVPIEVLEAVNSSNYPFVEFSVRLVLITFLSYRFLYSNEYKKMIVATNGRIEHEETCRSCSKGGDLLLCSMCEAVFHSACVNVETKSTEWICELCEKNKVRGVQDCLPLSEYSSKQPLRMEPIGRDRHGRFYWFVARRIFVHNVDESDLRYYSTAPQFYQLVKRMDPSFFEFNLCKVFFERLSDILEQMSVTLELSSDRRDALYRENYNTSKPLPAEVYLQQNNMQLMAEILSTESNERVKTEEFKEDSFQDEKTFSNFIDCFKTMLGFCNGNLVNNFWSGNLDGKFVASENELLSFKSLEENECSPNLFRMGCPYDDATFSKYTNFYVEHKYGEHPLTRKKLVDKKKYLCSKFSLMEDGEWAFEWSTAKGHNLYGSEKLQTLYVAWTIGKLLRKIPVELMQRKWRDVSLSFKKELENPKMTWKTLQDLLLRLECGMRRTLFLPQWWNSLGHTRLTRTTVEDRERMVKEAQRRKKEEREAFDVFDDDIVVVKHTRLIHGVSRELTRMRDEKYRLYGRGDLGGWLWISRTWVRSIRSPSTGSRKPLQSIDFDEEIFNRKMRHINVIASRLQQWRLEQEKDCLIQSSSDCYSPSCRLGVPIKPVCSSGLTTIYQSCYSQDCRRKQSDIHTSFNAKPSSNVPEQSSETSKIVKAYDPSKVALSRVGVLGEDLPWPLPEVNKFVSRGSKRTSIFVIPQVTLRRLAKTGGRKAIYVPSFSASAKSNLQYWNYPSPRPCFDLCWRWLTVNCTSLHAVALQLRILWASVRWLDMKPEDDDPDRRVVLHFPDRDERRWISLHKEYGPPCIYERYRISIEVLPLDDDNTIEEEDDISWTSGERDRRKSMRRRKAVQSSRVRKISHIKEEWVDGVDLKLYEIYDYWRGYNNRLLSRIKQQSLTQRPQSARPITKLLPASTDRPFNPSTAPNPRSVVAQSRLRYSLSRTPSTSKSELNHAPMFTTERKRKPSRIQDYEYYGLEDDGDDNETCDSTYNERAELTGWEPRVAKRQRLVLSRDSSQPHQLVSPGPHIANDRTYQVGVIRGGGRTAAPVGDGMQPAGLIEEGVVPLGAEETIVTSEGTNISSRSAVVTRQVCGGNATVGNPAVLSRCQSTTVSQGGQSLPRMLSSSRTGVINSSAAPSRPSISLSSGAGAGKLLMVRRSDGTTQFLRQISQNSSKPLTSQLPVGRTRLPQITRALPTQLVQRPVRRDQEQYAPNRVVAESSTVRPGFEQQSADPVMKRVAPGKLVYGSNIASSGMVRRQVVPSADGYKEIRYGVSNSQVEENVFQRVQDSRNNTSPSDRVSISGRYGQTSATYKVTSRGLASSSQDLRSEQNSHRVYYVKNALATTPSRVMLTPTSFDSYDHEEVVLDNDGIVIDGDETLDHADALSS